MKLEETLSGPITAGKYALAADLGGTNCTFGLVESLTGTEQTPTLKAIIRAESKGITNFTRLVLEVRNLLLHKYSAEINQACFAVAGPITKRGRFCKITNLDFYVDADELEKVTGFPVQLLNDFEAIGYGIDLLPKEKVICIQSGRKVEHGTRALLGAGTFLGKSILVWDSERGHYLPLPSEGGHGDLTIKDSSEFQLLDFLQEHYRHMPIAWGDVLSGKGIQALYLSLEGRYQEERCSTEIVQSDFDPAVIAQHHQTDPHCAETMRLFVQFYARCARNMALDSLAFGGVYIAGGIAAKNKDIFERYNFKQEFSDNRKMQEILQNLPVYVIIDYHVGLYGAAKAMTLKR